MEIPDLLPQKFFERDADVVAQDLLGKTLLAQGRVWRIVETEAYFGPPRSNRGLRKRRSPLLRKIFEEGDPASHAFPGRTPRNAPMFGPAASAYVFLIYGIHECLNIVTGREGDPQAVLLRQAVEVGGSGEVLQGPGILARAVGAQRSWSGKPLTLLPLSVGKGRRRRSESIESGPRRGITKGVEFPLRFWINVRKKDNQPNERNQKK